MFTGLVEQQSTVRAVAAELPGKRLVIDVGLLAAEISLGDSIAINGCCLTAVQIDAECVAFEAGPETLRCTNLGAIRPGSRVNIERSLRVGDRLGGHWVTGHVDAVGQLAERKDDADWSFLWFRAPRALTRQMAGKGCIAVDGVSLTLVEVEPDRFSVALIPHTLEVTTLGQLRVGDEVNLETDLLAKYVERQLASTAERDHEQTP